MQSPPSPLVTCDKCYATWLSPEAVGITAALPWADFGDGRMTSWKYLKGSGTVDETGSMVPAEALPEE